ncbi:multiubiquitin domain-containing protein [Kitasatospora sp. NA04385]|uniref:multiubiquitin domain-containing protein n=1 Tax=Kitasatospora sp. NA04385 TaxID=2742135 RepID=UPI00159262D8|nr:multiubiquitin domain-containing protein [Kitasatospora sp. NA04385]QKW17665.1 multiubiquitin domain-containing protein [Kitasatospora sp. NA04385]
MSPDAGDAARDSRRPFCPIPDSRQGAAHDRIRGSAHRITIAIDGREYATATRHATPAQLRRIADPDIRRTRRSGSTCPTTGPPGRESEHLELRDGMRFFSDPRTIAIFIDRSRYEVTHKRMTGLELRALPQPPVADDRDLWLDVVDQHDRKIADDEVVSLHDGMRFFTAPGRINPGAGEDRER